MEESELHENMPSYSVSRQDLLSIARENDPVFSEGQLKRLVESMMLQGQIEHVGRNRYRKQYGSIGKSVYKNHCSETALRIIRIMIDEFPLVDFRIWELSWLNEFFNHQIGCNFIFLETEKDECQFVFERMIDEFSGKVLLRPDHDEIIRYGTNNTVIVDILREIFLSHVFQSCQKSES